MLFSFVFNSEINELTNHKNHVFIFISFQGSLCNQEKLECIKQVEVDHSNCIKPCSGLVVTSFSKSAIEENIEHLYPISSAHENYKKITESPSGFKGILLFWFLKWFYWILIFKDFEWKNNLRFVRIYFDTPTFDRITNDRAATFVDMLSAIGGTMGLLTGFSIISGVEILYHVAKFIFHAIKKKKNT